MNTGTKSKNLNGFSLIELSIVIAILTILVSGGLSLSYTQDYQQKYATTIKNMKLIEDALTIYVAMNGRLPCPASPSQLNLNYTFGKGKIIAGSSGNPQSCDSTTSNINIFTADLAGDTLYYGAAPVTSLGLADEVIYDGWGNRIGYVVQKTFSNSSSTNTSCGSGFSPQVNHSSNTYFCFRAQASSYLDNSIPNLRIIDINGNVISFNPVYVIISHGENGYGAFTKAADVDLDNTGINGPNTDRNAMPPSTNYYELMNLNCNPSTGTCTNNGLNNTFVQNSPTATFDDIVMFKTRNNLLQDCNKYGNNACTINEGIFVY